jgi:hypothetical protein
MLVLLDPEILPFPQSRPTRDDHVVGVIPASLGSGNLRFVKSAGFLPALESRFHLHLDAS